MTKYRNLVSLVFIFLIIPSVIALPGFMIIEGNVKVDNRDADIGTIIKFYIENEEVASSTLTEIGNYLVLINKDTSDTGKQINITIDGYEAEQKINYNSPEYALLNLSVATDKALKITDYSPLTNLTINENENQGFSITPSTGYEDPVIISWFLNDELVSTENSYTFTSIYNSSGTYTIKVAITDSYSTISHSWELNVNDNLECGDGQQKACPLQQGVCLSSFETCTDGHWIGCNYNSDYEATETKCDNKDNNCDGTVDESLTKPYGNNIGECRYGTLTCNLGIWTTTTPSIEPSTEVCDNKDNDCNGLIDNNIADIYDGTDTGECQKEIKSCVTGSWQIIQNKINPATETCNNKDDDCDGTIDESLTQSYGTDTGECSIGTKTCQAGAWIITTPEIVATTETCDGKDNNCDKQIDEGNACDECTSGESQTASCGSNIGECTKGTKTKTCQSNNKWGAWGSCVGEIRPATEICDNKDNNCNGLIDDRLVESQSCTGGIGACARTGTQTKTCISGAWTSWGECSVVVGSPSTEICNNIDDDCDGSIDEGNVCEPITECSDNIDNDNDSFTDLNDVDCTEKTDQSESGTKQECKPGTTAICEIEGTKTCLITGFYGICENEKQPEVKVEQEITIPLIKETVKTIDEAEKTLIKVETNKQETGMELSLSTNTAQNGTIKIEILVDVPEAKSFTVPALSNQKFIIITPDPNIENDVKQALIKIYYTHEDLGDIAEADLRIYYFNGEDWVAESNSGVNTEENYVWAITNHLSLFTLGKKKAVQLTIYYYDGDNDSYGTSDSKYLEQPSGEYRALNSYDLNDSDPYIGTSYYSEVTLKNMGVWQNTEYKFIVCKNLMTFNTLSDGNAACKEKYGSKAKLGKCNSKFAWINTGCDPNYWKTWKTSTPGIQGRLCGCIVPEEPKKRFYKPDGERLPIVLHRTVKSCATKEAVSGEEVIDLSILRNGTYNHYECRSLYQEQCIIDNSFDTYYDEWCEY